MTDVQVETVSEEAPWRTLARLVQAGSTEALTEFVDTLSPMDAARTLAHLSATDSHDVLTRLDPEDAADLLELLSRTQAAELVERLEPMEAAEILSEMRPSLEADIVRELDDDDAALVLAALEPENAATVRALVAWDDDVAGGLMTVHFVSVPQASTAAGVTALLRADASTYRDYEVQYLYVVDGQDQLCGVLSLRDLVLADAHTPVADLMLADPARVEATLGLDALADLFDKAPYLALPVVHQGRMVGVVRRSAVSEELGEEAQRDLLKAGGIIGGEELRSMPMLLRARRRLQWLSINIGLNIVAAGVIAAYTDTLEKVIALAVFLPIISDMSGCSGNQAVAVSMRELSLGVARPGDALYVWGKEASVGVINGIAVGCLLGFAAFLWQGNPWLGLVAGLALSINTVLAVSIGGTVPLILEGMGVDPALASGPVLTTVTDLCGFLLVLGLATAMLPLLV